MAATVTTTITHLHKISFVHLSTTPYSASKLIINTITLPHYLSPIASRIHERWNSSGNPTPTPGPHMPLPIPLPCKKIRDPCSRPLKPLPPSHLYLPLNPGSPASPCIRHRCLTEAEALQSGKVSKVRLSPSSSSSSDSSSFNAAIVADAVTAWR